MNIFFRAILSVYAFCLALLSALTMLLTVRVNILDGIYYFYLNTILSNRAATLAVFFIALFIFIVSVVIIVSGFKLGKDKTSVKKHTDIGEVSISLDTLESIAKSAVNKVHGISDIKASVVKSDENIEVIIRAKAISGINIPTLSEQIQREVKQAVEESTAVTVNAVKVFIENISTQETYKIKAE